MLGRQAKIAVAAAAATAAVGIGIVAGVVIIRRRRKKSFLPKHTRKAITEALQIDIEPKIPGGVVGETLWRRHLEQASDKKLVALYAAAKAGEFMRERGIDPMNITPEQIEAIKQRFLAITHKAECDEEGTRAQLLDLDFAKAKPLLAAALAVLVLA